MPEIKVDPKDATYPTKVVYVGIRNYGTTVDPVAAHAYEFIEGDRKGQEVGYSKPLHKYHYCGSILEVHFSKPDFSQAVVNGAKAPRILDMWGDEEQVEKWSRLSDTVRTAVNAAKKLKAAKKEAPTWLTALRPVHEHYQKLRTYEEKAAFMAVVLNYVINWQEG